jgi:hypothetical protein
VVYNSLVESRFISEPISAEFDVPPLLEKKPGCPDRFVWDDTRFAVVEKLAEWHDYERRGRMAQNMQPEHLRRARQSGSWGVGRDFYRVRTDSGRVFEIYYTRAPKDADRRGGSWVLYRELFP